MPIKTIGFVSFATLAATSLAAQGAAPGSLPTGQWRLGAHPTGTAYETGTFDRPIDGGMRIVCLPGGSALLNVQIKGVAPTAGSRFLIVPTNRRGAKAQTFTAGPDGSVTFRNARTDRRFAALWSSLRGGTTATIRYDGGTGTFAVQSLAGASRTLPALPCR